MITIRKKIEVPEADIHEAISAIVHWFENNKEKQICRARIFGHSLYSVNRLSIADDVRKAASNAVPYTKA